MELGIIGLGRMGANMTERLLGGGHRVVAYTRDAAKVQAAMDIGAVGAESIADLVGKLTAPKAVWVMVPAGGPTEDMIDTLIPLLAAGDTIIDGGNANYKDSMRRAKNVGEYGLSFLDSGTSGGIWGLKNGYSLMVGGEPEVFARLEPLFQTLAPGHDKGYGLVGPAGAGHFTKMVHNGIEYGMMQAMGEGFEILAKKEEMGLDLAQVGRVWQHGSVIVSWLLDLAVLALEDDPKLEKLEAYVDDSGEGRWTVQEAIDLDSPAEVLTLALMRRFRSRDASPFSDRMLAALRQQFGGHAVKETGK
ncbi:MAG: decarboxylating 6-phosphogluconate dehydrogenase [Chloroflexota bacterium]|jgi:6-phosphogluconate dehydrogenase|nr:decarboxylating 6-phosphogluconate dehydrogenase [Chloroflexota bacterium]MDP6757495.1 decarboxylating 6-phosphogluconate dehydrogenase [Chloroflexota bacterium]